ncbi:activating signal cointegrator 1 complex subunit 3 [Coemansia thaxteri]|uniref:Activating signal cointegrator 1 complex subunit 3 n=1 Tax=Coemansia thaxteri TaxID=2663907 RepID=A0A9W8EJZ8_9FUNG|nr:activating signal cointegrator 1 complex subunit 3 [Coemansia thaxteri]
MPPLLSNDIPTFADLLRLRDSRREALLDRRASLVKPELAGAGVEGHAPVDRKGKGKGKGKGCEDSETAGAASSLGDGPINTRAPAAGADSTHSATAGGAFGDVWSELKQNIERDMSLRRALMHLAGDECRAPLSTTASEPDSGPELAEVDFSAALAPMPDILQHPDLPAYIQELETERDNAMARLAPKSTPAVVHNRQWLYAKCSQAVASMGMGSSIEATETMCTEVFTILRSDQSDNEIQGRLLELVGFDNMDFLGELISMRAAIVAEITRESDYARVAAGMKAKALPGVQAFVHNERDRAIERDILKSRRKPRRQRAGSDAAAEESESEDQQSARILGFGADLRRARERQLTERPAEIFSHLPVASAPEQFPHVYTSRPGGARSGNMLSMFGSKYALPVGTARDEFADHEEITIPVSAPAPRRHAEAPVLIEDMDPLCRYTFRKYSSLNRIQSIIYPTAYGTNENILLSAPTGAGKTDVALLTILRTISQFCSPAPRSLDWSDPSRKPEFTVAKSEFKIIYVAPMKALAAEVVEKYQSRLQWLGIQCRELTGDMQLTKAEVSATQIIVTTPEKWDVVTRKGSGDMELVDRVKLLIVDEIHLLNEDRGSVIETLIARTQRQVESRQSMIRLVGLSATLPNYFDVSNFLGVNPHKGLFYFDAGYRPVPLEQHFVGVHGKAGTPAANRLLNRVCYDRVQRLVAEGHQVMVFVHARKDTVKTAQALREYAQGDGTLDQFASPEGTAQKDLRLVGRVAKSQNRELKELFADGFSIHHAGMLRSDRTLVEELFSQGLVRVLCCTSTLAWGVNLPAYAVVIKGTQVYDSQKGAFVDLSILDVLQIFGRAGRPQYETHGVGYILTSHDRLAHYVSAITMQHPIESKFAANMVDNLNAEITLGTVTNVDEGVAWLGYTYMFIRMQKNPLVYGLTSDELAEDPMLGQRRSELVIKAAKELSRLQMIVFDPQTGFMAAKDLGRISSSYYLRHESVEVFNQTMRSRMTEADAIAMLCLSKELGQIRARNTEEKELKKLLANSCCCDVKGGIDSQYGKANVLLQASISRARIEDFSLVSDSAYVAQNGARIIRALFEIALSRNWGPTASVALSLSKSIEKKMWPFEHPLKQLPVPYEIIRRLESDGGDIVGMDRLYDMESSELGALVRNHRYGPTLAAFVRQLPRLELSADIVPITRNVLQVTLTIVADFEWNDRAHGLAEAFWIWVEDTNNTEIYHTENHLLRKKGYLEPKQSVFTIPVHEPLPAQIYIRAVSDRWLGAETVTAVSFKHLMLPEYHETHTDLLDLQPLPVTALQDPVLEEICGARFSHFNPVQTQIFHTLYRQPYNALVGAPTGSGKTIAAELAMWWAFREHPQQKVVYIAPLKALVKERVADWDKRLVGPMRRSLVEMTGDVTPDPESIRRADIIVTTPEKWDGVSRAWHAREYVQNVSLVIIDEIHLLGGDRGPILEVIVSRMNHIAAQTGKAVRVVGLSTALANARDLASWLGIGKVGLYNFRHSVRPVPLEIYIDGFPGRHYCPRMASMNRPAYRAIRTHSPQKPVIIFVSSRRQTRLTAQDLMAFCGLEDNPRHFLHMEDEEMEAVLERTQDANLRLSLSFGIGMHHAGLTENDRKICEQLFYDRKIQVLIATSTLAWGVNLPAHLVILKGTEFYDAKSKGYVDFPITDVLQMIGRAGRPQFDDRAVARIFVTDSKKDFYKRFLHEPFPVESSLHNHLHEHINAEIASGTVKSAQDAVDYLSWTYLYRRLRQNPTYYGVEESTDAGVNQYLSKLILGCFSELERALCITVDHDYEQGCVVVGPTPLGRIASQYYLSHKTMATFATRLDSIDRANLFCDLLHLLSEAEEWAELPVRHNEDLLNRELGREVPFPIARGQVDYLSPHAKTNLLLQKHLMRGELPCSDYLTDTRTVLDSSVRILQAMVDVAAYKGDLASSLAAMELMQAIKQATMPSQSPLLQLAPDMSASNVNKLASAPRATNNPRCLGDLVAMSDNQLRAAFSLLDADAITTERWCEAVRALPPLNITTAPGAVFATDEDTEPQRQQPSRKSTRITSLTGLSPLTQYSVVVNFVRAPVKTTIKRPQFMREPGQAYTPRFGKVQYEGWWAVLAQGDELVAIKRVSMQGKQTLSGDQENNSSSVAGSWPERRSIKLVFITPEQNGPYALKLHVVSDAYLGLDQQIDIDIAVGEVQQMVVADDSSYISKERMKEYQ